MRTRWRHRALALLLAIATVGCAGSGTQRASSSADACAPPKTVDERANGTAVRLCVDQILRVELHSTYWRDVASSQDAILLGGSTQALTTSPPFLVNLNALDRKFLITCEILSLSPRILPFTLSFI
jgi:hypothetical protein